jgi:hypothetical protein
MLVVSSRLKSVNDHLPADLAIQANRKQMGCTRAKVMGEKVE